MAVEIPVVVDIEGAFQDAAKRLKANIHQIQRAVEGENIDIFPGIGASLQRLEEAKDSIKQIVSELSLSMSPKGPEAFQGILDSIQRGIDALSRARITLNQGGGFEQYITDLSRANIELVQMSEYYKVLEKESMRMSNSINGYNARLSELREKWNALTLAEREGAEGAAIESAFRREISLMRKYAQTLDERLAKEERITKEAEAAAKRRADAKAAEMARIAKKQQEEDAIMNSSQKTIRVFEGQLRILNERLKGVRIGSAEFKRLQGEINRVNEELQKANGNAKEASESMNTMTTSMRGQSVVLQNLTSMAATYFSLYGALRFAKQIRDVTGELEYQRVALGHLIQDEAYGAKLFEDIKQAAIESPFRIKDLVTYTKQLSAYRIETTQLFSTTSRLADVSAGLGVDMNRLILAYGQVRAASVLRGQELRQFTEAGIPLVEMLADKYTELNGRLTTTGDIFEMISKRMIPFSDIEDIFLDLTDVGGQFFEMQETQAKTLQGRWEKLKDTFDIALQSIGESEGLLSFRSEFDLLYKALELVAQNIRIIPKILEGATAGWLIMQIATRGYRREVERTIIANTRLTPMELKQVAAMNLGAKATERYTKALIKQRLATNALSRSFWKLTAAMIANPVTAIIAGVAALTVALLSFRKKTDEATESAQKLSEWTDTIERQGNILSGNKRMDQLISRYERLASKTNLTAKEQQKLSQTMRILSQQFKGVNLELNNSENPISRQVANLKKLSAQQRETAISTLKLTKAQIEQRLTILGQEEQTLTGKWIDASSRKDALEAEGKLSRKQRKELKRATKEYNEYGDALNKTSGEITTLQNRLVSIENILNPSENTSSERATGDRLAKLRQQISDLTNAYKKFLELRKYLSDDEALRNIGLFFPSLGGLKPTYENTVAELEKMLSSYSGNADATRIIEQAIANIKFDKVKKDFDDALKRISSDIKRSETARNFYNDILGLTGDNELAASLTMSVYGTEGEEFADRIKKQLVDSLSSVDANTFAGLSESIIKAFDEGDYKYLMEHLEEVPEKLRDTVKQVASDSEKYNADFIKDMLKTYQATKDFEQRIAEIRQREASNRKKIEESRIPEEEKQRLLGASQKKEQQDIAEVEVERLKSMDEWVSAFEDLDKVGTTTLKNLISLIKDLIETSGSEMNAGTLRALTKSLEAAEEQVYHHEIFTEFSSGFKSYIAAIKEGAAARKELNSQEKKNPATLKKLQNAENQQNKSLEKMKSSVDGLSSVFSNLSSIVTTVSDLLNFDELSDGQAVLDGIATGLGLVGTALTFINAVLTMMKTDPIVLAISGAVAAAVALGSVISNLKVNKANRDIKEQDKLLEDLEYQYGRLQVAMEKSFGSDYIANYNQQLDNLAAKQAAYLKQAEAERSKGKKADEEKIKGYENSARDAADQIRDMQTQLAEFFSGTDLTSAAKDFANAWIEAYKEFGSVTDAMSEKFNDMIQEMVENSVAAQVMQQLLKPIFDEIDRRAREGGELSTEDIAAISKMATEQIPAINDAMATLMNSLQAAGYDFRQQPGQFTGISRNIANATEESITGLAAGINTQNFYMSMINQNVAAILAVISGGAVPTEGAPSVQFNNELALQRLSGIDDKLATLLNQLDKVIKPMSVPAQYYVSVRQ